MLLGAAIGDIVGSRFEFDNYRATDFDLFTTTSIFTDDTICTVAVAEWLQNGGRDDLAAYMRYWCRKYDSSYGGMFRAWLESDNPQPYNSYGNGSAMRVSPVAWHCDTLAETLTYAEKSAAITHNHPEGIKGAQATAAAIFLARNGEDKAFIKSSISNKYGYDLNATCDAIRPHYHFNETCQDTVPQAIVAFLESRDFEDAIRLAVSLGGDSDTLAAITGSIAEAYYADIPAWIRQETLARLPADMLAILGKAGRS